MSRTPLISIVVPVYNAKNTLRRCIESIFAQTYSNFELLLIDDGSSDCSGVICDEYAVKDSRVRVFHKSNGGVSSARNLGLDNACGEWVTFCDADDFVFNKWLENFNIEANRIDYDLIGQSIRSDRPLDNKIIDKIETDYYAEIETSNPIEYCQSLFDSKILGYMVLKLFRRSIIKANNLKLDEGIKLREDLEFILRYIGFCNKKLISYKKVGYYYYVPLWQDKYQPDYKGALKFYRSTFDSVKKIGLNPGCPLRHEIREGYINVLIKLFKKSDINKQRLFLLEIKDILKTDFKFCQMNSVSKFIILNDSLNLISLYFFKLYQKIR